MNIDIEDEVIRELRKVRAPAKVARNLGIDLRSVLEIADKTGGSSRTSREEQFEGEGRPELRQFLVARKRAHHEWDNEDPLIAQARADYEAGTHEMATGRDGDWLILYSIPRNRPQPRPNYFRPEA